MSDPKWMVGWVAVSVAMWAVLIFLLDQLWDTFR